ncbi:hypothetical protein BpHYR1_037053 [Brachionus plicatilis]|uniref:Uncharacterized protein n=1 Tax=Brachionus plicatilis TaxID=10195 RepID=A0A3M7SMK3_BRAPC|nr:hypothetical protein BpHYR1_037053 [Brachionus plicatilis]
MPGPQAASPFNLFNATIISLRLIFSLNFGCLLLLKVISVSFSLFSRSGLRLNVEENNGLVDRKLILISNVK